MTERIVIIDHENHTLYIEDVDVDMLESKFGGEEERYIKETYEIGDNYSWDFITNTVYMNDEESIDLEIESYIQ